MNTALPQAEGITVKCEEAPAHIHEPSRRQESSLRHRSWRLPNISSQQAVDIAVTVAPDERRRDLQALVEHISEKTTPGSLNLLDIPA